jgi:hypothetical protein
VNLLVGGSLAAGPLNLLIGDLLAALLHASRNRQQRFQFARDGSRRRRVYDDLAP